MIHSGFHKKSLILDCTMKGTKRYIKIILFFRKKDFLETNALFWTQKWLVPNSVPALRIFNICRAKWIKRYIKLIKTHLSSVLRLCKNQSIDLHNGSMGKSVDWVLRKSNTGLKRVHGFFQKYLPFGQMGYFGSKNDESSYHGSVLRILLFYIMKGATKQMKIILRFFPKKITFGASRPFRARKWYVILTLDLSLQNKSCHVVHQTYINGFS